MTSEPHRRAIGSLRAVALDAPDIDRLATFYEQLAGWRRVPDDDDDWITLDTGDGWRIGLQRATDHVPPDWPDQSRPQQAHLDFRVPDIDAAAERAQPTRRHPAAPQRAVAHAGRPGRPSVRPVPQPGRSADHPDGRHARLPRREGAEPLLRGAARQAGDVRGGRGRHDRRGRRAAGDVPAGGAVHGPALAGSGVPAADPPRRDGPGRGCGGTGRPRHRRHPAGRRRPELARLRRSGRQAIPLATWAGSRARPASSC